MWCSLDNRERLRSKEAARWLFNPLHQKDMQEVCSYAEVCPELVKGLAKRLWLERLAPNLKPYHQSMWREVVGR